MESKQLSKDINSVADLFAKYRESGDTALRNELVSRFLYLAEVISKKFLNRGTDYDDIYQVASIALIKAVERFDPARDVKFVSFATPTILGEIKRYFRDKSSAIRIPRRLYELHHTINEAKEKLSQELNRTPTVDEIAAYLKISPETILESLEAGNIQNMKSFDQPVNEEDDMEFKETVGDEDHALEDIGDRDFIEKSIGEFGEAEKKFISMRYYKNMTQKAIADKLGVSQMYVSRMERKILQKFRLILKH